MCVSSLQYWNILCRNLGIRPRDLASQKVFDLSKMTVNIEIGVVKLHDVRVCFVFLSVGYKLVRRSERLSISTKNASIHQLSRLTLGEWKYCEDSSSKTPLHSKQRSDMTSVLHTNVMQHKSNTTLEISKIQGDFWSMSRYQSELWGIHSHSDSENCLG